MSGKGTKLNVVGDSSKIAEYVASHAGSMGFVSAANISSNVKVLLVVD
jgi:hypothetical protein